MVAEATGGSNSKRGERATLPRSSRIIKSTDYKRVFEGNAGSFDRFFRIIARPSSSGRWRLGLAVSKKTERTAVGRNRIKRVVRESFRKWRATRKTTRGLDIVVLARPQSATICNEQLFKSLEKHWPQLERVVEKRFSGSISTEELE